MNDEPQLSRQMSLAAQAFAEHCTSDPAHEIGLLATSPFFPGGNGQDRWIAHHWIGKGRKLRRDSIPEGVDLQRVTGAVITEDPASNLALWLIGFRPGDHRLNVRMFVVAEDPAVLADPDRWAMGQIAAYAKELEPERGE